MGHGHGPKRRSAWQANHQISLYVSPRIAISDATDSTSSTASSDAMAWVFPVRTHELIVE